MTPNDLLRDADAAMYRAKARGRDCVEAFEDGGHEIGVLALRTSGELRRGIERGEIVPYFQPIVDLASGRVLGLRGAVALAAPRPRVCSPPSEFLPLAEEIGCCWSSLGARILPRLAGAAREWRAAGRPFANCTLSVNVGTRQLVDPSFYDMVVEALAETRHRRRRAVARDHRDGAAVRREVGHGRTARPAQPRPAPLGRRLRHRLLVVDVPEAVPGRGDQDRQVVRLRPRYRRARTPRSSKRSCGSVRRSGCNVVAEGIESPLQLPRCASWAATAARATCSAAPAPPT